MERKGLSIIEASFVLVTVVAATLMMQIYLKRAIQGRLRAVSDGLSETQYSPGRVNSDIQADISLDTVDTTGLGWSSSASREMRARIGNETVYVR